MFFGLLIVLPKALAPGLEVEVKRKYTRTREA